MKKILLPTAVLLLSGCMAKTYNPGVDKSGTSAAYCHESVSELDCDWQSVTSKWDNATPDDFSDIKNAKTE